MKRILLIACGLCCLLVSTYTQIREIPLWFLEEYGIDRDEPCNNDDVIKKNTYRVKGNNCDNLFMDAMHGGTRGKEYAPYFVPNANSPIMNVRINLIFIQKDDGTGNFQENNPEHQKIFDDAIADLNSRMGHLIMPGTECFSGTEEEMVHDIRIRFVDHRYYIRKSTVWDNGLYTYKSSRLNPSRDSWYLKSLDDSLFISLDDTLKGINIYLTESAVLYHRTELHDLNDTTDYAPEYKSGGTSCSMFPIYSNWNCSSRLHLPNLYSKYWHMKNIIPLKEEFHHAQWNNNVYYWFIETISKVLIHELGHSFNLLHREDEKADSFYPGFNCEGVSIMCPNWRDRNYLHPNEIGRMYVSTMSTNLQQFVPFDTYLGNKLLNTSMTLPHMRMYHSLLVGESGNITIPCDITFSPQCSVTVQNGGVFSVDGATLQSSKDKWNGVVVNSGGQLRLSNTTIGDYDIIVKSGGSLVINNDLAITGNHSITVEDGGYLCISDNASINLVDGFSTIIVSPNAILGCPSCNENCISARNSLTNFGNGRIVTYEGTDYLQNITITTNHTATGSIVKAGYDVTNTKPVGNVVVENGGNLKIKANETTLTNGVEVKLGGTLEVGK